MSTDEIGDAVRSVARLDMHADIGLADTVAIDGLMYTGADLRRHVAQDIAHRIELHNGVGSWTATRALKNTGVGDVRVILMAWGASHFTIEQHARAIAAAVRAMGFNGSGK